MTKFKNTPETKSAEASCCTGEVCTCACGCPAGQCTCKEDKCQCGCLTQAAAR